MPLFHPGAGKPYQVYIIFDDITERRQIEKTLQDSEVRYRRLFETAQDGILILDAETGEISDVNPFLVEMLGYSHEDFLGKKLWELGVFKDVEASKAAFTELQAKGYGRYNDLPLETKDGRPMAVEFVSNVYLVNHHKVIQCNIRDITERKHIAAALRDAHEELERR
ncbi:MAG: PAS domain S-box protein, partial [Proteobacteria bacterium]|nr:PAS domain S-box protein [Pseudomonadota bacterium]